MALQINHPLDCPICDQGGECDLQDQVMPGSMENTCLCWRREGLIALHINTVSFACSLYTKLLSNAASIYMGHTRILQGLQGCLQDSHMTKCCFAVHALWQ